MGDPLFLRLPKEGKGAAGWPREPVTLHGPPPVASQWGGDLCFDILLFEYAYLFDK